MVIVQRLPVNTSLSDRNWKCGQFGLNLVRPYLASSESARREVLGRFLALKYARYAKEVKMGLHSKGKAKAAAQGKIPGGEEVGVKGSEGDVVQGTLF